MRDFLPFIMTAVLAVGCLFIGFVTLMTTPTIEGYSIAGLSIAGAAMAVYCYLVDHVS